MGWKAVGDPVVRRQRGRWTVRVEGIDTETGRRRPRQLGTFATQRAALKAASSTSVDDLLPARDTVGWVVRRYVAGRSDVTEKTREQYRWATTHIEAGLGGVRLDQLDRADVAQWMDGMARAGKLSWRSIQVCRTVLRAALADAVEEGLLRRSPAARVPMPRKVAKPAKVKEAVAWDASEVARFLEVSARHRWAVGFRVAVLYGLRRSEVLAVKWDDVDLAASTLRVDEGIIALGGEIAWTEAKNARSRRTIPIDADTISAFARHRREQLAERLRELHWEDHDMVIATRAGRPVLPRSLDRTLELLVRDAGLPKLTSHGLRHTAATQMVAHARDVGELRAIADLLGHSPDILMNVYAHALPDSTRDIADRIGLRAAGPA